MAIKRKDASNGAIKDSGWISDEQSGPLIHHLVSECTREKIMVSFSVTRLGDFSITLVFGKGETEKYYCGNQEELFMTVVDITGGSGETEMYTSDGEVLSPADTMKGTRKGGKAA